MTTDRWRHVQSLCHAALARPANERAAFLADACRDDPSLCVEVQSLIAHAQSSPSFLETPVIAEASGSLVGRQLGAYRIDAAIGVGGMGEVYRAKDTRLQRDVALKILPAAFGTDPQRRTRFEREARAVAALNHPNICTIHDVGQADGVEFLVMELIDGESLAARLKKGPLPLAEALARGIEIADALDKAHGQGIIHRDLKPGNVMLAKRGPGKEHDTQAKLLDFGIARFVSSGVAQAGGALLDSTPMTQSGVMLGTLQYMAPEQIEGRPADARTDIFAFGALLYEMVTGRRAFEGTSTAALMAAILREDPPPVHPTELGRIVRRCLAKDPVRRYQSARDLLNDLEESQTVPVQTARHSRGRIAAWATIACLAAAVAAWGYAGRPRAAAPVPSYRPLTFERGVVTGARFSTDGQTVYYSAAFGTEPPRVYMTRLEGAGSVRLDLPPATLLAVAANGELGLLLTEARNPRIASGTLARASALGEGPRPLLDGITDADWTSEGKQLAVRRNYNLEFPPGRVIVPGEIPVWPRFSPKGDRIAYIGGKDGGVHVVDLEGRRLLDHKFGWAFGLAWRPDGREIWFTGFERGADPKSMIYGLSLSGERRLLAAAPEELTIHDIAKDGTRALVASGTEGSGVQARSADGTVGATLDVFGQSYLVGLSDDGKQALLHDVRKGHEGLHLRSTDASQTIRLSDDLGFGLSPDGRWALTRPDPTHLALIPTGAGEAQRFEIDGELRPCGWARWSRDGRRIFMALVRKAAVDDPGRIYVLDPPRTWRNLAPAPGVCGGFVVSPDGGSIASLDRGGSVTLYPVEGGEPRTFVEEHGVPVGWSSDGRWLYLAAKEPFRARVYRRELASGRIESWREIKPSDPAGVVRIDNIFVSGDGRSYAYTYTRSLGVLYLVERLQ